MAGGRTWSGTFRIGDWLVEPELNQLVSGSAAVRLEPRVMDLLVALAQRPGRVWTKHEILDTVWGEKFLSDAVLSRALAALRRGLGDDARAPRFIETVPRRGYRLLTPVEWLPGGGVAARHSRAFLLEYDGREIALAPGEHVLGRGAEAAVRVHSAGISRRHARISVTGERAVLEDLGSKNGTVVRGKRVEVPTELVDGDEIWLGTAVLRFRRLSGGSSTETDPHAEVAAVDEAT